MELVTFDAKIHNNILTFEILPDPPLPPRESKSDTRLFVSLL